MQMQTQGPGLTIDSETESALVELIKKAVQRDPVKFKSLAEDGAERAKWTPSQLEALGLLEKEARIDHPKIARALRGMMNPFRTK
jgi:hypothetical protein